MRNLCWSTIVLFYIFSGCTKIESTTIGTGLIPPIDGVNTLDTFLNVVTNNYINPASDSARILRYDDHIIGVINNDPIFGKTTATTYFQLEPTFFKYYFPGAPSTYIVDSAVLIMSYKGTYGDTTSAATPQTWEVKELSETLRNDTAYSVNKSFSASNLLGTATIRPNKLADSVNYGFENAKNQIRIRLTAAFANKLLKQFDSTTGNAYVSDSLFKVNFKGFAVGPSAGSAGNALIRINLLDTNTKLALFYKYKLHPDSTRRDTTVSYFRFRSSIDAFSAHANYIKRNYVGAQVNNFNNTSNNDSLAFVQTSPGTFVTIKIPGLRSFPNAIIHRAELITLQQPDVLSSTLTPPRLLLLSIFDSSIWKIKNVPNDFFISSGSINFSNFGGNAIDRDVAGVGIVKEFAFDLSRYVQGIVTRKDSSYTLRLSAPSNDSLTYKDPYPSSFNAVTYFLGTSATNNGADGRVRLGGGGMASGNKLRMRLRIIYSKI